jgi:hypothetical protein
MSYEMATLIVLFPLFLVLMRFIRATIAENPGRAELWVRRWALFLTLFIAVATVAGDLITLIMYFFNGDVTLRFGLKVLVILLVAGGGFLHFLADLHGYWQKNPRKARTVGYAVALLILVTIVSGFFIIGTPWQARLYRYDDQKVSDLQSIQYQVVSYWQAKEKLPTSLTDLSDALSGSVAPIDPQSGTPYEYQAKGNLSFELCANFNAPMQPSSLSSRAIPAAPGSASGDSWQHGAGRTCFTRIIDPERYPPYSK